MEENHENSSGFASGLMLGIIVGAASVVFFQTDKGKKLFKEITEKSKVKLEELSENDQVKEKIKEAERAIKTAKVLIEKTKTNLVQEAPDIIEELAPKKLLKKQKFFTRS